MFIRLDTRPKAVLRGMWDEILVIEENAEFKQGLYIEAQP